MLKISDLKVWLHRDIAKLDKLLLLLASIDGPCQVKDVKEQAKKAGLHIVTKWKDVSSSLSRSKGMAIRTHEGWEITEAGKLHLKKLGIAKISSSATQVAIDLQAELANIRNEQTRSFLDEAIKCYEHELYRSAIVMSWIGAVHILHDYVSLNHMKQFNEEAKKKNPEWKHAKTANDLNGIGEAEFLDRITAISILDRNVKKELKNCLDRRNSCSHPGSLQVSTNTVAHHIEILLLNVFKKFQ